MARIRLNIDAAHGEVSFDSFIGLLENWLAILRDLDSAVSSEPAGTLKWSVTELSLGSAAVGIRSQSTKLPQDYGPEVATRFVEGFQQIEEEGTTPPYFSAFDLGKVQQLGRLLDRDGEGRFSITDVDRERTVEITRRAGVNAGQLMSPKHSATGSVTGRLEMISVHRQPQFSVYHARTNRAVRCRFKPDRMMEKVKDGLGRRVLASGTVHYNYKDEPIRVDLEDLEILPAEEELPKPEQLLGMAPDFTGESSTEQFLRRIRDA